MSETPTGTDRVELTDDELIDKSDAAWLVFSKGVKGSWGDKSLWVVGYRTGYREANAEAAARVQALTAERDELSTVQKLMNDEWERITTDRDAARAELAAANTRLEMWWKELENANGVRDKYKAENAALQATLDRVTALADEADRSERHINGYGYVLLRDLRAALTPEGKP